MRTICEVVYHGGGGGGGGGEIEMFTIYGFPVTERDNTMRFPVLRYYTNCALFSLLVLEL